MKVAAEEAEPFPSWVQGGALVAPPGVGGWEGERGCGVFRSLKGG